MPGTSTNRSAKLTARMGDEEYQLNTYQDRRKRDAVREHISRNRHEYIVWGGAVVTTVTLAVFISVAFAAVISLAPALHDALLGIRK